MRYGFINNFSQLLASDLTIGATTMTLDGGGALLVNASADLVYTLTLDDGNGTTEIVHVTAVTTNTLTIVRAQEGTTAQTWPTGTPVEMRMTAGVMSQVVTAGAEMFAIGRLSSVPSSGSGIAFGLGAEASGNGQAVGVYASALGVGASAYGPSAAAGGLNSGALLRDAQADAEQSMAVGYAAWAQKKDALSLGANVYTRAEGAIGLGSGWRLHVDVPSGIRIAAVPYLPDAYDPPEFVDFRPGGKIVMRNAALVAVQTDPLDLTTGAATVDLDVPAGTRVFLDAIDVVVVTSSSPGGAPEIRIGPDDVTPAAYLGATSVTSTIVGERETHAPLIANGVTSLRVETVTAGTGTLTAKIVFRGYVMEL